MWYECGDSPFAACCSSLLGEVLSIQKLPFTTPPTAPSMLFTLSPAAFQAAPITQVKSHKLTARQQAVHILSHNIKTTNGANSRPHDESF